MYVLMYVYKYNLIVYGIRWYSCRVENTLTLGKLLRLWFCFLLHSILFFISQTSYRTYKIISSYELARPIMGTIFLVIIGRAKRAPHWGVQSRFRMIYVVCMSYVICRMSVECQINCVGGITWPTRMLKVFRGRLNQ